MWNSSWQKVSAHSVLNVLCFVSLVASMPSRTVLLCRLPCFCSSDSVANFLLDKDLIFLLTVGLQICYLNPSASLTMFFLSRSFSVIIDGAIGNQELQTKTRLLSQSWKGSNLLVSSGVSNVCPSGQIQPTKPLHLACWASGGPGNLGRGSATQSRALLYMGGRGRGGLG